MRSYFYFFRVTFLIFVIAFLTSQVFATTVTVAVSSYQFTPSSFSINVGDSVKFQWIDGSHTTTCDGVFPGTSLPAGAATWDEPMHSGATVYIYHVTVAGTYNYVCIPHSSFMTGTFTAAGGALLTENFDYPAGDSLGMHGWVSFSGGSTNYLRVSAPGMTYSGYILSNIGNASSVTTSGQDAYKNFSSPDSIGSLYISFMVNVSTAQTGDYFFALLPPTSTTLYTARFYAKDSSGGLAFGLSKSTAAAGGIFYTGGIFSYNTNYLVVVKYTFVPGTDPNDVMNVYVFSSGIPSTEPSTPTIGPVTGTAPDNTLGRIALRQGTAASAANAKVDGFNVSKSWNFMTTSISNNPEMIPTGFNMDQNYPNPFNPNTTIKYSIYEKGFVNLTVYNSLGIEVRNLVNSVIDRGSYSIDFNGSDLNSGVYFYKLVFQNKNGSNFVDTKKFILLK